jgi:hypothetical protein
MKLIMWLITRYELQFNNELYTYGGGFRFSKTIAKVTNELRAGLAYESWYSMVIITTPYYSKALNDAERLDPDDIDQSIAIST